jgi:hypothetical protein
MMRFKNMTFYSVSAIPALTSKRIAGRFSASFIEQFFFGAVSFSDSLIALDNKAATYAFYIGC